MAKKPAITGVARPQGFIDDAAKAIGKALRKPKSVTVNKIPTRTPPKSKQIIVPNEFGLPRVRQKLVISSKPKNYSETYMKGTKEYKEAIRAEKIKSKSLKDVNKYDAARKRRATEYNSARKAEAIVNKDKKKYGFVAAGAEADFVKKFIKMSPKKVKSGKR
jgi:hypothetical protein